MSQRDSRVEPAKSPRLILTHEMKHLLGRPVIHKKRNFVQQSGQMPRQLREHILQQPVESAIQRLFHEIILPLRNVEFTSYVELNR